MENKALEERIHKLIGDLTAEKKRAKSLRKASSRRSCLKTPQSAKGTLSIKQAVKKHYADECELSEASPPKKSERASAH